MYMNAYFTEQVVDIFLGLCCYVGISSRCQIIVCGGSDKIEISEISILAGELSIRAAASGTSGGDKSAVKDCKNRVNCVGPPLLWSAARRFCDSVSVCVC